MENDAATLHLETDALYRLVYNLPQRHQFLKIEPIVSPLGAQAGNTGIDALLHLARYSHHWLRSPEDWTPSSTDSRELLSSLTRHLFARYPMSEFMDSAWVSGFGESQEAYRRWFVHLGNGGKLEELDLPLPMTHRAAHYFLAAPSDFSISSALRYGQYRALGASDGLIEAVLESFLSELQPDEAFWFSVAQFLVNNPRLPRAQVGPVLDYLRFCRFGSSSNAQESDPTFTMKGRTIDALLKRMGARHETLARLGMKTRSRWEPSGIAEWDNMVKDSLSSAECRWRIVELTESMSLAEEGSAMRHCVRSYQDGCQKGEKAIFSLRCTLSDSRTVRRLLTIEVNLRRRAVVQVRGKCNQTLSALRRNRRMALARDVLRDWARSQHLGIACGL